MALQVFRYEGPPMSGRTTAALSQLYQLGLRVPSTPDQGNEDVSIVEASALIGATDPGSEMGVMREFAGMDETKDNVAQVMMELSQGVRAKACIIERTRDLYAIAGEHARDVMEYIHYSAQQEGFQFLVFEDAEPSVHETEARAVFDSLPWLKGATAMSMPIANPLNTAPIINRLAWDNVSSRVVVPFSMTRELCEAAGWRLGPLCEITQGASNIRLAAVVKGDAHPSVTKDDVRAALRERLMVSHGEHAAIQRSRFARSQFAEPLCKAVATYAHDGGVLPTSDTVKQFIADQLKAAGLGDGEKPSNGAVWKAARALIDDRILWIGPDGRALLRDSLLGVRLLKPDLQREVEEGLRRERATRAVHAASRSM